MPSAERWPRVSRTYPCPICQKADWCQVSPDGAIAGCMRVAEGAFKARDLASGAPCYYHRLAQAPSPPPPQRRVSQPLPPPCDIARVRALYATLAAHCAAALPDHARQDLVHRFGQFADAVIAHWGIGYCPAGAWLPQLLRHAGHRGLGRQAGVLTPGGATVGSLAGRLVIPYRRGGQVCDLRGAGLRGRGHTGERNLHGAYRARRVDDLFFNHDALDRLAPGGTLHLAGGAWKAIALALVGLPAVGTRGEGELTEGQLRQLVARRPGVVVLHVDAEDPRPGRPQSEGRRLGRHKARRLVAAGLAVRVAEPPREPGTPKADPDALLRTYGPALLRACAFSALPLEAWELALGAAPAIGALSHSDAGAS